MRRLVAPLATLACIVGFVAAPAPPATADTVTVADPSWSVTLTFPDMQWGSTSCQFLPVTAEVAGATVEYWTFGGFVTPRDNDEYYDEDEDGDGATWFIDYDTKVSDGTGSFTFRHAVMLCPNYDSSGVYDVAGEVGVRLAGGTAWSWLPYKASFTVIGLPTTTTLDPITLAGPEARFSGATTFTPFASGASPNCGNGVDIQVQVGSDWEDVGWGDLSKDGSFATTVPTYRLTGTQYRARFGGSSICAGSNSEARLLPVSLPIVRTSTLGKQSKFKVDIDPNMGSKAWVFQVQRRTDDDQWRTVATYRTQGRRETRTINMRQGVYRIRVKARFGYAETYSDYVYLER